MTAAASAALFSTSASIITVDNTNDRNSHTIDYNNNNNDNKHYDIRFIENSYNLVVGKEASIIVESDDAAALNQTRSCCDNAVAGCSSDGPATRDNPTDNNDSPNNNNSRNFRSSFGQRNQRTRSVVSVTETNENKNYNSSNAESSSVQLVSAYNSTGAVQQQLVQCQPTTSTTDHKLINNNNNDKHNSASGGNVVSRSISLPPAPRKPPRRYHYTDIRQMLTPASVLASTSAAAESSQGKHPPIRIAQPPNCATSYGTMPQPSQRHPHTQNVYDDTRTNYTTVFHANPANGSTTMSSLGGTNSGRYGHRLSRPECTENQPPVYRQLPLRYQEPTYQQPMHPMTGGSMSMSNIGSSGCTSFPASNSNGEALLPSSACNGSVPQSRLLNFQSVPALGVRQQQQPPLQPKQGIQSSASSLLRHQKRVPYPADTSRMNATNLFDMAYAQQRQIDANRSELEERRRLISATIAASSAKNTQNGHSVAASGSGSGGVTQQVQSLKEQIARDEVELAQLSTVQREARQHAAHNHQQRQELQQLEKVYAQDDAQLRQAVSRVDTLKKQLDLLYQRRAVAASAAIAQQRKINAQLERSEQQQQSSAPSEPPSYAQLPPKNYVFNIQQYQQQQHSRPQASVGPFQFQLTNGVVGNMDKQNASLKKSPVPSYKHVSKEIPIQRCYDESQRFLARGKPEQVSIRADSLSAIKRRSWAQVNDDETNSATTSNNDNIWRYLIEEQRKGRTHISFADIMAARETTHNSMTTRHPIEITALLDTRLYNEATAANSTVDDSRPRSKPTVDVPPLQNDNLQRCQQENNSTAASSKNVTLLKQVDYVKSQAAEEETTETLISRYSPKSGSKLEKTKMTTSVTEMDDEDIRNDSGSDDTSNTTTIEPDEENEDSPTMDDYHQQFPEKNKENDDNVSVSKPVALTEETWRNTENGNDNKKEEEEEDETTVIVKTSLAENENSTSVNETNKSVDTEKTHDKSVEDNCKAVSEIIIEDNSLEEYPTSQNYMTVNEGYVEEDDDGFMEEAPEYQMNEIDDDESTTSDEVSSSETGDNEPVFDEQSICVTSELRDGCEMPKGILRAPVVTHHKRHVVFDQTVLFLDVAYGGEYDMLVELASKIPDISVGNGEGITALHNAICAGNQDIVNFLIENHADVNALDLDGWSPLHCAASCNNVVMLRQLVENGACVFATTLSKAETASDLFEETHEPFESGADYIQHVENCMGAVNDGKIYAAFSYNAENEDELSFEEGDELRVIDRFDQLCSEENERSDAESDNISDTDSYDSGACEGESSWWLCESTADGKRGLVPRNYIAFYPKWKFRERYGFRSDTRLPLPSELAGVRTVAQRRRRRRRKLLAEQQQDEHFMLLQWSNLSAAAAATEVSTAEKDSAMIVQQASQQLSIANSVIVNKDDEEDNTTSEVGDQVNQDNTKL